MALAPKKPVKKKRVKQDLLDLSIADQQFVHDLEPHYNPLLWGAWLFHKGRGEVLVRMGY